MVKQDTKVRFLMDSGILDHNAEICVLSGDGRILFRGMAWEMDDDVLDLDLKHILSVWTSSDDKNNGRVWIETFNTETKLKPQLCVKYDEKKCVDCKPKDMVCFEQRRKSSHGGFVHEEPEFYYEGV